MRSYRLYLLDSLGSFVDVCCRQAPSDDDAVEVAHQLLGRWRPTVEVWEGARFVTEVSRKAAHAPLPTPLCPTLDGWLDATVHALSGPDTCPTA